MCTRLLRSSLFEWGDGLIPQSVVADSSVLLGKDGYASKTMGRMESIEQFRELMEHLQQVFWIKTATKTRGLYVSPAYEKI